MDVTESTLIGCVFFLIGLILFVRTRANISLVHISGGDGSSSKEASSREIKSRDTAPRVIGLILISIGILVLDLYEGKIVLFSF
jgi:hypothetical protein